MRFTAIALCIPVMFLVACENKEHKKCLEQVDEYQKKVADCGKITDEAKRSECLNLAEVGKITRENCDESFK